MARQVTATIQCAGQALVPGQDILHVTLTQTLFDHHALSLVVPFDKAEGSSAGFLTNTPHKLLGQALAFTVQPDKAFGAEKTNGFEFKSLVIEMGTSQDSDGDSSISVQAYSPSCLLMDGMQKRTFVKQTLADIFERVLSPYVSNVLTRKIKPQHKAVIPYAVQYHETNFAFLSRLAAEYGEWFYYDGNTLVLGPPEAEEALDFVADGVHNGFHIGLTLHPTKYKFHDYNHLTHQRHTSRTAGENVPFAGQGLFGDLVLAQAEKVFQQESHMPAELAAPDAGLLREEARVFKAQRVANMVALQGYSDNSALQVGRTIRVSGKGLGSGNEKSTDFGVFRVVEVVHQLDGEGNYSNTFTAIPAVHDVLPVNPHFEPPTGTSELAEVVDVEDPNQLGRVRVRYLWPTEKQEEAETDFIRVITPYSGDGKGQLFTPEVGSQVLVGYENGLAEFPVVLGNLFHPRNPQGAKYTTANNQLKGLQTAGGNKLVFSDVPGSQSILISNSNKKGTSILVSFEENGSISLTSNGPINLTSGDNISIDAKKNISIRAGEDISLAAKKNVLVETQEENVSLRAQKEILLTAISEDLTLEAAAKRLVAKSADNVEISAAAVAKIMGGDIKWSKP